MPTKRINKARTISFGIAVGIWGLALFSGWTVHKIFSDWMGYSIEAWEMLNYFAIFFQQSDNSIELLKLIPVIGGFGLQAYLLLRKRKEG